MEQGYSYIKGKTEYNSKGKEAAANGEVTNADWKDTLPKVPKHTLSLKGDYHFTDKLTVGLTWKYTGSYNNSDFYYENGDDDLSVKSNTVVDLSIRYNNPSGFSVYGGINNLFNEEYFGTISIGTGFTVVPEEGRTFYSGFSYTF